MNVSSFERIRVSLTRAEDACIAHLVELTSQSQPVWDDINKGYCLVNELREIHDRALDEFALRTWRYPLGAMSTLLKRSAVVLTQSLLTLDQIALRYYSRS